MLSCVEKILGEYFLRIEGKKLNVCRAMLLKLYQISVKRLRVSHGKILANATYEEKRGNLEIALTRFCLTSGKC